VQQPFEDFISDEIAVDFNMFGALMEDRVLANMDGRFVVTM